MKDYINQVLGNSLRCILPSFWWKRLLGMMVDKIESAESSASSAMKMATLAGLEASDKQDRLVSGSNIKTICGNSILGSGNITPDPSMKVYIPMGGTLSSYYKSDNQSFYRRVMDGGNWVNSWRAIAITASSNKEVVLLGVSYNTTQGCRILISGFQEEDITDKYECVLLEDGSVSSVTKVEGESGGSSITVDSEVSETSENPVQNKAIKAYIDEQVAKAGGGSLSINELDITSPAQIQGIIAKVREGEHDIYWVGSDTQSSSCLSYYIYDDLSLFVVTDDLCMSIFDLQGNKIIVDTKYRIYGPAGASTATSKRVDKNSVMYRMIADGLISGADCYLHYADNGKDYKVNQCEMTTVGSTTYLCLSAVADGTIIKLRMLNSGKYYDSTTEPLISFDSELSDTSTNAVENKVVTETLNTKADKSDIKTINGVSLLGGGNIVVDIDTSNLATKEELTEAINTKQDKIDDLATIRDGASKGATAVQYITEADGNYLGEVNGIVAPNDEHYYLPSHGPEEDKVHTFAMLSDLQNAGGVSQEDFDTLYNGVVEAEEVTAAALNDLNDRISELAENVQGETVTKEEFEAAVNNLNESLSEKADAQTTSEALTALSGQVETLSGQVETAVTSEQLSSAVDSVNNTILENEEVTAAALNDLNSRIKEIITRLNNAGL